MFDLFQIWPRRKEREAFMRLIVYGDLHGCFEEFLALREKIKPQKGDLEICVGDIINKGLYSKKLIKFIKNNNIKTVLGNHEEKFLKYKNSLKKNTQTLNLNQKQKALFTELDSEDILFLSTLPYYIKVQNITVLHGGLWRGARVDRLDRYGFSKLVHTRYLDKNGKFISLDQKDKRDTFWAEQYGGEQGFVVYGHQVFKSAKVLKNSVGLDTGCVYGNKLSAGVFEYQNNRFDTQNYLLIEQKSKTDYSSL